MANVRLTSNLNGPDGARYAERAHLAYRMLFEGKWSVQILCALRHGPIRLGQLGRLVPGASKKVLAHCLRKLEAHRIVVRHDLSDIILHVEYELHEETEKSVIELLDRLANWGEEYVRAEARNELDPTRQVR